MIITTINFSLCLSENESICSSYKKTNNEEMFFLISKFELLWLLDSMLYSK